MAAFFGSTLRAFVLANLSVICLFLLHHSAASPVYIGGIELGSRRTPTLEPIVRTNVGANLAVTIETVVTHHRRDEPVTVSEVVHVEEFIPASRPFIIGDAIFDEGLHRAGVFRGIAQDGSVLIVLEGETEPLARSAQFIEHAVCIFSLRYSLTF